jgi:hypothetical protein
MQELMIPDDKNLARIDTLVTEYLETEISGKLSRALVLGHAITSLNKMLTKEIMTPILQLKGSKLGFRTDKDGYGSGYSDEIVKRCFIESLLLGVEPVSNQWNIIAGNLYITKEGCTHLLSNIEGLKYSVVPQIPKVMKNPDGDWGALCKVKVEWQYRGEKKTQDLEFACKGASDKNGKHCTGADAYNGKAERKAKHWLYCHLSGQYVGEGDIEDSIDVEFSDVTQGKPKSPYAKKETPVTPVTPVTVDTRPGPIEPRLVEDEALTDREVDSRFHFLVEKIGTDLVSAYFAQVGRTTLVLVKQDYPRMVNILNDPPSFTATVEDFWANAATGILPIGGKK